MRGLIVSIIALAVGAGAAVRAGEIELEDGISGGTACADGGVSVALTDGELEVTFDHFGSRVLGKGRDRQTCLFSIPVRWERGHRLVLSDLSVEGYYRSRGDAEAVVRAELFTAGGAGTPLEIPLLPNSGGRFEEELADTVHESRCTGSGLLRLNSSIRISSPDAGAGAGVRVKGLKAKLSLEPCQ